MLGFKLNHVYKRGPRHLKIWLGFIIIRERTISDSLPAHCHEKHSNETANLVRQLTRLPLDKMATISQTTFSDAFSGMQSFVSLIKISLKFVPGVQLTITQHIGLDNGLAPNRQQAIIWTNADPIHWRIYAALRGDELTPESSLRYVIDCLYNCDDRKCLYMSW